jgi:biopolymer transport protein ExbB
VFNLPITPLEKIFELLEVGGPVVYILTALSLIVLAVSLAKIFQFAREGIFSSKAAELAVKQFRNGRTSSALSFVANCNSIRSQIVARSIRGQMSTEAKPEAAREDIMREAGDRIDNLYSHLRILELIASLAPLLGLFGTVLGMIDAFQKLENSGNQVDPSILSGGIWLALLTTAVGLAVAMPTVAINSFFERRLERLSHDLESLITQIFVQNPDLTAVREIQNNEPSKIA